MRTHVEIDTSVHFACLHVAQKLQEEYRSQCDVQIAIFAQEPLFNSKDDQMPEPTIEQAKKNINLVFDIADTHGLDLVDFHLDYNLDPSSPPLIYEVIAEAKPSSSNGNRILTSAPAKRPCPRITIGHATQLPVTFVGLPQSDMYMQGRTFTDAPLGAPRGTLRVPYIAQNYGIEVAMSVNNVDNAFTPQGVLILFPSVLLALEYSRRRRRMTFIRLRALASQVFITIGMKKKFPRAYALRTIVSQRAIGLDNKEIPADLVLSVGDPANFVFFMVGTP
ncbi:Metallo-dependent hydrolase [Pholiota molesta]|nr:Metallo-dependent hydrolase [Pholiota molesta]